MTQLLIVRSKLKELVKKYGSKDQVNNISADLALRLSQRVESMVEEAVKRAHANKRRTVLPQDI